MELDALAYREPLWWEYCSEELESRDRYVWYCIQELVMQRAEFDERASARDLLIVQLWICHWCMRVIRFMLLFDSDCYELLCTSYFVAAVDLPLVHESRPLCVAV